MRNPVGRLKHRYINALRALSRCPTPRHAKKWDTAAGGADRPGISGTEMTGGRIARPIFEFPGGRRLHFVDPDGYELAIWSKR